MNNVFVPEDECNDIMEVRDKYPWYAVILPAEGGFWVFPTYDAYNQHCMQV
jgi:hypothetical protein